MRLLERFTDPVFAFSFFLLYVCPVLFVVSGLLTLVRARARLKNVNPLGAVTLVVITLVSMALHYWLMQQRDAICGPFYGEHYILPFQPEQLLVNAALRAAIAPLAALFLLQRDGRWHQALVAAMLVAFYPPANVSGAAIVGILLGAAAVAEFRRQRHWIYVVFAVSTLVPAAAFLFWDPEPVWTALIFGAVISTRWLPGRDPRGRRWIGWEIGVAIVLTVAPLVIVHELRELKQPELFKPHGYRVGFHDVDACPQPEL